MKIFVLFAVLFLAVQIFAQDAHQKIRAATESRDYKTALTELQNLRKSDRKIFEANNYDYLMARTAERLGDYATATATFQAVVKRNSILSEYALWHLAQISRSTGNLILERNFLNELQTLAPESLLKDAVNARLARSFFESKDYNATTKILLGGQTNFQISTAQNQTSAPELSREHLALLGQSYLLNNKPNEAREVFLKLVLNLPNPAQPDDFALTAVKGLDALDGKKEGNNTVPELGEAEHFRRAKIYQFNRDFPDARLHFQAIVQKFPQSQNLPESLYTIGRGYALEGNFQEAIKWFERTSAEYSDNNFARDALMQVASGYARVNKPKEAVTRYKQFIEKYKDADNIERAYLNIVDIMRDSGEETDALEQTQKTREAFKGEVAEAIALFARIHIRFAQNDWENAYKELSELEKFPDLGGTRFPGATNKAEVAFLKAYALEQSGKIADAITAYLNIPDGRAEYYGWRSTERLRAMRADEKTKQFVEAKINELKNAKGIAFDENRKLHQSLFRLTADANYLKTIKEFYAQVPNYKQIPTGKSVEFGRKEILKEKKIYPDGTTRQVLADELIFLGLYDEGTPELETALREKMSPATAADKLKSLVGVKTDSKNLSVFPPDTAYTLAVFYKRGDMANRAVSYIEPFWRNVPADYQIELIPRDQLELLYPAPYADSLLKFAPERELDPRYVLSIMRQESRYRADVKSVAAARGLMQFIPDTSNKIADELKKKNFVQDELYHPPTAVLFGSQYLSNLFKMFPAQPQAVAASYNGGENNMSRWMARAKSTEADRYVPEILFSQSKDYVYKVLANYRVYQILYDEKLKTR